MKFNMNIDGLEFGKHSMLFRITACRNNDWDNDLCNGRLIIYMNLLGIDPKKSFDFTPDGIYSELFCSSLTDEEKSFISESLWSFFNASNFCYSVESNNVIKAA